jgi:hypothetical protein
MQESAIMGGGSLACQLHYLSPEISIELRHLSERKEQGFHIRYWGDFRFPYPSKRVKEEPEAGSSHSFISGTSRRR